MNRLRRYHSLVVGCFLLLCTGCSDRARAVAPTRIVAVAPISSETSISIPSLAVAIVQSITTRSIPTVVASDAVVPSAVPTATTMLQRPTVAAQVVVAPTVAAQPTTTPLPPTALSGNGPAGCSLSAQSVSTVITPSGAALIPGASLSAIWHIRNDGTCVGGQGYQFVYVNGTQLSGTTVLNTMPTMTTGQNVSFQVAHPRFWWLCAKDFVIDTWQKEAHQYLDRIATGLWAKGLKVQIAVVIGSPASTILQYVHDHAILNQRQVSGTLLQQ